MASERDDRAPRNDTSPAVTEAEVALRSAGARNATFHQQSVGRGRWFADWSGTLADSDVYIAITGKGRTPRKVRLLLDDWIFDDVAAGHLGGMLSEIFSGGATIRTTRAFLIVPVQSLKVSVGRSRYSAARKLPPDGELSPWERALADG
ncbi:hypothetical protein [Streptomyces sp. NPDC088725]|uniref:hypothetical protein n=1 Tax=Streptomyces sp. NPDC088725 TaxID=3365873 RepID=UPI0038183B02